MGSEMDEGLDLLLAAGGEAGPRARSPSRPAAAPACAAQPAARCGAEGASCPAFEDPAPAGLPYQQGVDEGDGPTGRGAALRCCGCGPCTECAALRVRLRALELERSRETAHHAQEVERLNGELRKERRFRDTLALRQSADEYKRKKEHARLEQQLGRLRAQKEEALRWLETVTGRCKALHQYILAAEFSPPPPPGQLAAQFSPVAAAAVPAALPLQATVGPSAPVQPPPAVLSSPQLTPPRQLPSMQLAVAVPPPQLASPVAPQAAPQLASPPLPAAQLVAPQPAGPPWPPCAPTGVSVEQSAAGYQYSPYGQGGAHECGA
eukprot:TRINITY_DN31525_c0_g1_i2.p1 TRINITY_DN31525_c0_g1~~TRINITY_DN31525_c0_g1_i2.p1  ORF type:complete len:346 (+),score=49.81 TRINITY_DN31525_c0_g1_i2:73-1038(+)